ncbi:MAG: ATP-binding protein [Defluviitaleaceae bacterium]|nr:ATP-binding protein [Defluviitaleaceae bacterium]
MGIVKNILKFISRFEPRVDESVRETFEGELQYECGKLIYVVFVSLLIWLPYIFIDITIHQYPAFVASVRAMLTIISVAVIILRFTKYFEARTGFLLKIIIGYLYAGAALIAGTAGEASVTYTGGYTFVVMTSLVAPFSLKYKATVAISTFFLYLFSGMWTQMDFSSPLISYALRDVVAAIVTLICLSHILNKIRYTAWEQRTTILNLAHKAEASDRAKSEFLATMSHEIRTPLNAIIGIAQIELQNEEIKTHCAESFERIFNSGNNLLGIINDILDMSKIETGKLELNPAEYDIAGMIHDAAQLNIVRIGSKPIQFALDIEKNLPSRLFGDELRIKQILNNLLSNGIKYTDEGQVKLSVNSKQNDGDETVLIFIVSDTGQGMKQQDQQHLFDEYLRFNAEANRTTEGTGLGLSITKRLVELMDGTITAESEYGKGSKFTVKLKQKTVACEPIGAETAESLRNFTYMSERLVEKIQIVPMPHGSVLVVDDMETNLYVAEGLLSLYELDIDTADSGFAALEKIKNATYDIIFMDHMMPEMDGIETTKKMRESGYRGKIVALTANALVGNDEMFIQNGFDGFIPKPIDTQLLHKILNKFIARAQGAPPNSTTNRTR